MATTAKKSVRWSTVTVYEFGVAIGGSAVPKRGGPAVGLAKTPEFVWSARVDAVDTSSDSDSSTTTTSSSSDDDDDCERKAPARICGSDRRHRLARKRRVRWLKPLERVNMLEQAGCSEKRIVRTMLESSEIAMSRRLCVSIQRRVAV